MPLIESVQTSHWDRQRVVVAFGTDHVAKLTPADDDRLLWERRFAHRVLNYLLDNRVTPCVTRYHDSVRCEPRSPHGRMLWRRINVSETNQHQSPLSVPSPLLTPTSSEQKPLVGFVVERARGITLHQWAQGTRSMRQWQYVLFQLLYTIDVMRALGIRHNDMHWDNVFVDERGWSRPLRFRLPNGRVIDVPAGRSAPAVRLIDFDKASIGGANSRRLPKEWQQALQSNPTLENSLCTSYGLCNRDGNDKYDAHTVLCFIMYGAVHYGYRVPETLRRWIQGEAMPQGERLYATDFKSKGGYTCRLGKPFCSTGVSYQPDDQEQQPTLTLLTETSLFASLGTSGTNVSATDVYQHPEAT